MLFLALSCLQGRPMGTAIDTLLALGPDGLQLTPGNQPTPDLDARLSRVRTRTHHGFTPSAWKQRVWSDEGTCLVRSDSVHPPLDSHPCATTWEPSADGPVLESMYPGSSLGTGDELEALMNRHLPLALDVSHVFLQRCAGVISERTWRRLQDYPRIEEVHVSRNEGRHDSHLPLRRDTFGLAWALERLRAGTPVILESYFHRLSDDERQAQVALFDGARR